MKAKVATLGYERIKTFKIWGNSYEIYGKPRTVRRRKSISIP